MALHDVTTDRTTGGTPSLLEPEPSRESPGPDSFCTGLGRVPAPICANCHVRKRGANCWEADGAPCCNRGRHECDDCEVKIAYLRATSENRRVRLTTTQGLEISGHIRVPKGRRFSDFLNELEREFLAITDAIIQRPRGHPSRTDAKVILLNKREICLLIPEDGELAEPQSATVEDEHLAMVEVQGSGPGPRGAHAVNAAPAWAQSGEGPW